MGSCRKATRPTRTTPAISSEVATGRRMNNREGLTKKRLGRLGRGLGAGARGLVDAHARPGLQPVGAIDDDGLARLDAVDGAVAALADADRHGARLDGLVGL